MFLPKCIPTRRVTRGGRGERSSLPFSKNMLNLLNFSFKMQFLRVPRRKNRRFFHAESFFLVLYMTAYQSALISRKLPCLKNFLVTRSSVKLSGPAHFLKSQGNFFLSFPCTLFFTYF